MCLLFSARLELLRQSQGRPLSLLLPLLSSAMFFVFKNITFISTRMKCFFSSSLSDVPAPEQPELFLKKLQQCCTVFDFMDTLSDLKMKEYKRSTLNELVDYVTVSRGYLTEQAYPDVVKMVRRDAHSKTCCGTGIKTIV